MTSNARVSFEREMKPLYCMTKNQGAIFRQLCIFSQKYENSLKVPGQTNWQTGRGPMAGPSQDKRPLHDPKERNTEAWHKRSLFHLLSWESKMCAKLTGTKAKYNVNASINFSEIHQTAKQKVFLAKTPSLIVLIRSKNYYDWNLLYYNTNWS